MKLIRKAIAKVQNMTVDLLICYSDELNERAKSKALLEAK